MNFYFGIWVKAYFINEYRGTVDAILAVENAKKTGAK